MRFEQEIKGLGAFVRTQFLIIFEFILTLWPENFSFIPSRILCPFQCITQVSVRIQLHIKFCLIVNLTLLFCVFVYSDRFKHKIGVLLVIFA